MRELCQPILAEREDNEIFDIGVYCLGGERLEAVHLSFSDGTDISKIAAVRLYYGGMESHLRSDRNYYAAVEYISAHNVNNTLRANPSLSVLQQEERKPDRNVTLAANVPMSRGVHYYWISIQLSPTTLPSDTFSVAVTEVLLSDSKSIRPKYKRIT